jgi:hypothetical protein
MTKRLDRGLLKQNTRQVDAFVLEEPAGSRFLRHSGTYIKHYMG